MRRNLLAPENSRLLPILISLLSSSLALSLCLRLQTVGCKAPARSWAQASRLVDDDLLLSKGGERVKFGKTEFRMVGAGQSSLLCCHPTSRDGACWAVETLGNVANVWLSQKYNIYQPRYRFKCTPVSGSSISIAEASPPSACFFLGMGDDDIEAFLLPPLLTWGDTKVFQREIWQLSFEYHTQSYLVAS